MQREPLATDLYRAKSYGLNWVRWSPFEAWPKQRHFLFQAEVHIWPICCPSFGFGGSTFCHPSRVSEWKDCVSGPWELRQTLHLLQFLPLLHVSCFWFHCTAEEREPSVQTYTCRLPQPGHGSLSGADCVWGAAHKHLTGWGRGWRMKDLDHIQVWFLCTSWLHSQHLSCLQVCQISTVAARFIPVL